jgi:hypothetical protein
VLTRKIGNVGFVEVATRARVPFGLGAVACYPLFPPEFLEFVRRAVPPERHDALVHSLVVTARRPPAPGGRG